MKTKIPYHPELRELIPSLGFNSATHISIFLQKFGVNSIYRITYCDEDQIEETIEEINSYFTNYVDTSFIFVMNILGTTEATQHTNIAVICWSYPCKKELIKYLKLKAFS